MGAALFAGAVFAVSLLWLWLCGRALDYVADDALILFRHVDNHARGLGMVWDRWHPVQAHSSVLWAWTLRLALALGVPIETAGRGLGIVAGAGCASGVAAIVRPHLGGLLAGLAAAVAVTFPALALWASAGLETALAACVALLVTSAVGRAASSEKAPALGALLLFISPFVRPDLPLQLLGGLALVWLAVPPVRPRLRGLFAAGVLGIAAYVALNRLRYGASVALPVLTKLRIEPRNLLRFVRYGALFAPQLALLWGALVFILVKKRRRPGALGVFAGGAALATLAELALLGGDELSRGRFLILPFLCTLCALATLLQPPQRRWPIALALLGLLAFQVPWALHPEGDRPCGQWRKAAGLWLRQHTSPSFTLAVAPAGYIPFHAQRDTIDLMGLAHAQIAALPEPRGSEAWGDRATELAIAEGVCGVVLAVCDSSAEDPRLVCPNQTLRGVVAALRRHPDYAFLRSSTRLSLEDGGTGNPLRIAVRRSCTDKIWGLVP